MFTSGTTGRSKGVIKQHAADYFSARSSIEAIATLRGVAPEDLRDETYFSCLPLFHSNAQVLCAYPALIAGARVAFVERFSGTRFWQQAIDAGRHHLQRDRRHPLLHLEPAAVASSTAPTGSTRSRAAPAPKDIYHEFEERFGVRLTEGYGLTETGVATMMDPTAAAAPRGRAASRNPGYEVTIVEPGTDLPLPPDTPGEIVVDQKIPNIVMRAYYGMPEKTAEDFRNLKLHTGDLGRMDADGYVYFMDRVKDYIRRRGENVSSMEVEKQVVRPPRGARGGRDRGEGRRGGLLRGRDHDRAASPEGGRARPGRSCLHWMAERMPYFMVPRYIRFVDALPKTPTERVQKVKLREEGVTPDTFDREAEGITIAR